MTEMIPFRPPLTLKREGNRCIVPIESVLINLFAGERPYAPDSWDCRSVSVIRGS